MKKSPSPGTAGGLMKSDYIVYAGLSVLAQGAMTFFRYASQNKSCGFFSS
jgi:hypothetical protein